MYMTNGLMIFFSIYASIGLFLAIICIRLFDNVSKNFTIIHVFVCIILWPTLMYKVFKELQFVWKKKNSKN
jgi:hypothetical protein